MIEFTLVTQGDKIEFSSSNFSKHDTLSVKSVGQIFAEDLL